MLQMQTQSIDTQVTCSTCERLVSLTDVTIFEFMEAIDGNPLNLTRENIRLTGQIGYECEACFLDESQLEPRNC